MMQRKYVFTLTAGALAFLVLSAAAAAPTLTFTFKDVVAKGAAETDSYAINKSGQITGDYVDSAGAQHGLLLTGTKVKTVDNKSCVTTPGSGASAGIQFYGINSAGELAGYCLNTTGATIGFTWAKGKFTNINIKGALAVEPSGVNDAGDVVGAYIDSNGAQHGFVKAGKTLTKLDPPGESSLAQAWSINNSGVVTVFAADSNGKYISFTTANKGKTYKKFNPPGQGTTGVAIHGINNLGDINSTIFDSSGNRHGVLLHKGKFYSFDDPNGVGSTRADGINDTLEMVGRYGSGTYGGTGFLAKTK